MAGGEEETGKGVKNEWKEVEDNKAKRRGTVKEEEYRMR